MPGPGRGRSASLSKLSTASKPDLNLSQIGGRSRSSSLPAPKHASSPEGLLSKGAGSPGAHSGGSVNFSPKGMQIKSGNATLNLSPGKLSINSGNTQFDLHSLADGIKMQARDTESGKLSSFSMTSRGTKETHRSGKSISSTQTQTHQFGALANSLSNNLWQEGVRASTVGRHFSDVFAEHEKKKKD